MEPGGYHQGKERESVKKLKSSRGETLVETLCALLLITMTSSLFLTLTLSSARISSQARADDKAYRRSLSVAEAQSRVLSSGNIVIRGRSYPVTYYGSGDGANRLVSYGTAGGRP